MASSSIAHAGDAAPLKHASPSKLPAALAPDDAGDHPKTGATLLRNGCQTAMTNLICQLNAAHVGHRIVAPITIYLQLLVRYKAQLRPKHAADCLRMMSGRRRDGSGATSDCHRSCG